MPVRLPLISSMQARSVAFCEWIEATFDRLDSCDAATITLKAQETFLPSGDKKSCSSARPVRVRNTHTG